MSSADTPGTETPPPVAISIELMLYEAGMIANSLSSKALGGTLAQKLADTEGAAEQAGNPSFQFTFSPFEAGMALNGMSRTEDGSLDDVKRRLSAALAAKMQELGINPLDGSGGTLGGEQGAATGGDDSGPLGGSDADSDGASSADTAASSPDATGDDGSQSSQPAAQGSDPSAEA